jgi:hypothetical protein
MYRPRSVVAPARCGSSYRTQSKCNTIHSPWGRPS